jgi:hypothetical protein
MLEAWLVAVGVAVASVVVARQTSLRDRARRQQAQRDGMVASYRGLRAVVDAEMTYRDAEATADRVLLAYLDRQRFVGNELGAAGLQRVATLVATAAGLDYTVLSAWYVDAAATTAARCAVARVGANVHDLPFLVWSVGAVEEAVTVLEVPMPWPPHVRIRVLSPRTTTRDVLAIHAGAAAAIGPLHAMANRDAVVDALVVAQTRALAWRRSQQPDTLLRHDLRALLGARYDERVVATLTEPVPRAAVVSRR